MSHIESLHIEGFKKFKRFSISMNPKMNILVGENESGKSTILEALKIVLNQQYKSSDRSILLDLFNADNLDTFKKDPSVATLPKIVIEAHLDLDPNKNDSSFFYGEVYGKLTSQPEKYGIRFECKFDLELGRGMEHFIQSGNVPLEYYSLSWTTFAKNTYRTVKRPFGFLFINTTASTTNSPFDYYTKALFATRYDDETRARAKSEFRSNLDAAFDSIGLEPIGANRKLGINGKKVLLESIVSVYEDSIALENRGSGMESLIKTQIALDRATGLDVILMEEPENHLCLSSLNKMLHEIIEREQESQIIITTHSNMIASRLNLNNVFWITENMAKSLKDVDKDDADFFVKADNNAFLQLLLSEKTFLVEGATEFILLPKFYEQTTGKTMEADGVTIVSCGGISYKRYLEIAEKADKKVSVITDNDADINRVAEASAYNKLHGLQHIFLSEDIDNGWTWEACLYRDNRQSIDELIEVNNKSKYLFHGKDYGAVLGKMLNNKADTAYKMLQSDKTFVVPQHVREAIQWLAQ